ncbi:MAG TPA: ABC transporter permease [Candidatus Binatia bacterium]|nr:ABC transporter permease [Candidatus Binatia bacterium]
MHELLRRYGVTLSAVIICLVGFWLLCLVVLPNITLLQFSFRPYLPVDQLGGPDDHYTLKNYATFLSGDPAFYILGIPISIHLKIFLLTVLFSSMVTVVALVVSYPLAFYLAKVIKPANAPTVFLMLLIPLWVSEILRSFAWFIVLAYQGPLNAMLSVVGIGPIRWISGFNGVIIGLVYTYVLFMLFPIYNAITSLDTNQIEAAQDLGAPLWRTHWRVVIPHAKPGIASGCVMVFMLSAGSIIVPSILASPGSRWFTQIIQQWMFEGQDWNTGSAYAFLLLVLCTVFVSLMMRLLNVRLVDIAK